MFKPSCAEISVFIKSVSQLKQLITRPAVLCKDCQRHFSASQKCTNYYSGSVHKKFVVQSYQSPTASPTTVWSLKKLKWHSCLSKHMSNTTGRTPDPSKSPASSKRPQQGGGTTVTKSHPTISPAAEPVQSGTAGTDQSQAAASAAAELSQGEEDEAETLDSESSDKKKNRLLHVIPRMRKPNPIDYSYTGNIYILPQRALVEYLLKPSDIADLPKYSRRSPYAQGSRITLFLRSDVEEIALRKWGGFDKLNKEKARLRNLDPSHKAHKYDVMDLRTLLREMHSADYVNPDDPHSQDLNDTHAKHEHDTRQDSTFWGSGSTRVVMSAILVNGANSLFKLIAWLYTGSHSMFAEFIHSCADTMNQIILGFGLYHSFKKPDTDHPYGYRNLRNISSLISGVGIFFFGTGLSYYHSLQGFLHPQELGNLYWCLATLAGSFISEGATLIIAVNQVKKSSKACGMSFKEYLVRGVDPNVNVVMLEDFAAVLGVGIAATCITVSAYTGSSAADALGSALIGTLLGSVAAFIVHQNTTQLVGRSIPLDERQDISQLLEHDRMIRSLHDIKATQMGGIVRYKAEVDFDGREITRAYLYKQDMEVLLQEAQNLKTVEEFELFMLNHGEKIIDALGEEVDRIEKSLKTKHPEIRHVDLEAL